MPHSMGRSQSDPTDSVRAVSSIQHVSATVEPDYFQFYLQRSGAPCRSDQVTDEGYEAGAPLDGGWLRVRRVSAEVRHDAR